MVCGFYEIVNVAVVVGAREHNSDPLTHHN